MSEERERQAREEVTNGLAVVKEYEVNVEATRERFYDAQNGAHQAAGALARTYVGSNSIIH